MRYQNKWLHSNLIYNELKDMRIFGSDNYAVHCKDIYLLFLSIINTHSLKSYWQQTDMVFSSTNSDHMLLDIPMHCTSLGMNMNILEILVIHQ